MPKLTVAKTTYGVSNHPVIMLNFNDGGEVPTAYIENGTVPIEIVERIGWCANNGWEIEYVDHTKMETAELS